MTSRLRTLRIRWPFDSSRCAADHCSIGQVSSDSESSHRVQRSMESAKTMKRFVQLRLWPDAVLKIINFQSHEEKARQLLNDAAEYCRAHGYRVEHDSNTGSAKDFILPMAVQWQADMIVLGNSAGSLLVKRLIGETSCTSSEMQTGHCF